MRPAPKWFLKRFEKDYDIEDGIVVAHLSVLWKLRREGRKRLLTDESVLGDEFSDVLTSYGRKLVARRRRAGQLSKASRRVNQNKAAAARRKRQKKHRRAA